jgi:hypothetical protein
MLCRRNALENPVFGFADGWFSLFAEGTLRLGNRFDQNAYYDYLVERHGMKGYLKGLSGIVLRSYFEPTCFGSINVLSSSELDGKTQYLRCGAPAERSHFPAYSAYLFLIWDDLYPGLNQLAIDDFFTQSRCLSIMGWDRAMGSRWLDWMTDRGLLQLDRQTGGTLALRLMNTEAVVGMIFDEAI